MTRHLFQRRHFTRFALALWAASGHQARANGPFKVLVLGDSLSAEYGLPRGTGWVKLLADKVAQRKAPVQVVNASISGDTTSGGRSRLPALLAAHQPGLVVIELGGNDALRGLPVEMTQDNLTGMVKACQTAGAKVLLLGMQIPPNFGASYARQFNEVFSRVAQQQGAGVVPFFLRGVADAPDARALFQPDQIHPTAQAQPLMLGNVWPALEKLLP
jgi:acyl-CoA thioesterase I